MHPQKTTRITMLIAAALISLPTAASALGTGRAAGTPLTPPAQALDAQTCLSCHTTISKLHTRGAHKDVNCGSCHTVKAEHFSKPSAANRPTTRFDYESCSQCHTSEHQDLMNPKYHYAWAKMGGNPAYSFIRDQDDGWPRSLQYRFPRNADSLGSLFILGFLCNIFVFLAVEGYRSFPHAIGKYAAIFLGIAVFILSGYEHSIADMFYYFTAGAMDLAALGRILVIALGNTCGGLISHEAVQFARRAQK